MIEAWPSPVPSALRRGRMPAMHAARLGLGPLLALLLAGCQTAPKPPDGASSAASGGSAAQAHQRVIDAYNTCNEGAFVGAYAPLFTFASSNTRQPVTTRDGLQRYLASGCGGRPNPTVALVQQSTRVSGAITVFAGQYRFKVPTTGGTAGAMVEVLQNFTVVFERMGERWLVLAHHLSVAP